MSISFRDIKKGRHVFHALFQRYHFLNFGWQCVGIQQLSNVISGTFSHDPFASYGISSGKNMSTVDVSEVEKFSILAESWWNESGEFAALHTLNGLRLRFVANGLVAVSRHLLSPTPLKGMSILDVGCGGGIFSEPLARLGAEVTGIDASEENIQVANRHASYDPVIANRLQYFSCPVEKFKMFNTSLYDAVILSEILEHVENTNNFLTECCSHVKIGGSLFITTINRTSLSYLLAIVAAEKLLRIVPYGAHDWNKFLSPHVLQQILLRNSFSTKKVHGMALNPLNLRWSWVHNTNCNYALHAVKN